MPMEGVLAGTTLVVVCGILVPTCMQPMGTDIPPSTRLDEGGDGSAHMGVHTPGDVEDRPGTVRMAAVVLVV